MVQRLFACWYATSSPSHISCVSMPRRPWPTTLPAGPSPRPTLPKRDKSMTPVAQVTPGCLWKFGDLACAELCYLRTTVGTDFLVSKINTHAKSERRSASSLAKRDEPHYS